MPEPPGVEHALGRIAARGPRSRRVYYFFLIILTACLAPAWANEQQARLDELHEQIEILQAHMADTRDDYGKLQQELRGVEREITALARQLGEVEGERKQRTRNLEQLRREQTQVQARLTEQKHRLARQIRATYIMGRQDYLKMLLNQEDPAYMGRILTYYDYFNRARARNIETLRATLARLERLTDEVDYAGRELGKVQKQAAARKQSLEQRKQERRRVLENLQAELAQREQHLDRLRADAASLEEFLRNPGVSGMGDNNFAAGKGSLPAPGQGEISAHFGAPRGSGLKWNGLLIAATAGSQVRSVAAGQVVFADWLRNFGQLVIIDHGGGYMSLYGHNRELYKQAGDRVEAGEAVAAVGDSGGREEAGLYFEIRRDGKPLDPEKWLAKE